jgi:ATP-dependent 26S proteasome regulatory subunit
MAKDPDPVEVARAIQGLFKWASENVPPKESMLRQRLSDHLEMDPGDLPVVARTVNRYEHPNFQVALEHWSAGEGRSIETIGLSSMGGYRVGLGELARPPGRVAHYIPEPGPVEHVTVEIGPRKIVCVEGGLFLIKDGERRLAALLKTGDEMHERQGFAVEVMASEREVAEHFHEEVRSLMDELNVYRGQVLTFSADNPFAEADLRVLPVPTVTAEQIVFPDGLLERIRRQTIGFASQAERLKAAGRHIKRGLLLYGPPGTGKTFTAMHLAKQMPDRTVLILSGRAIGAVGSACEIARTLQPALVILEDVDLVAEEREMYESNPLLFELLNAMDGVGEDADIIFMLTTNRVSVLEPALASRPGRIDEAIELPLPDADGRARLFALYGDGLGLEVRALGGVIEKTEGVSPAFIRELCRRAALLAAETNPDEIRVTPEVVSRAHEELTAATQGVTQSLLGADPSRWAGAQSASAETTEFLTDED